MESMSRDRKYVASTDQEAFQHGSRPQMPHPHQNRPLRNFSPFERDRVSMRRLHRRLEEFALLTARKWCESETFLSENANAPLSHGK